MNGYEMLLREDVLNKMDLLGIDSPSVSKVVKTRAKLKTEFVYKVIDSRDGRLVSGKYYYECRTYEDVCLIDSNHIFVMVFRFDLDGIDIVMDSKKLVAVVYYNNEDRIRIF